METIFAPVILVSQVASAVVALREARASARSMTFANYTLPFPSTTKTQSRDFVKGYYLFLIIAVPGPAPAHGFIFQLIPREEIRSDEGQNSQGGEEDTDQTIFRAE